MRSVRIVANLRAREVQIVGPDPPGLHVAERDQRGAAARAGLAPQAVEPRPERVLDPVVVKLACRLGDAWRVAAARPARRRGASSACPTPRSGRAGSRPRRRRRPWERSSADRAPAAPTRISACMSRPVLGAEVAQQRLLGDAGPRGQRLQRHLRPVALEELFGRGLEQRLAGSLLRLRSRHLLVRAASATAAIAPRPAWRRDASRERRAGGAGSSARTPPGSVLQRERRRARTLAR